MIECDGDNQYYGVMTSSSIKYSLDFASSETITKVKGEKRKNVLLAPKQ